MESTEDYKEEYENQFWKNQLREECKEGWHNPRKIPLRSNHIKRADNYRNRNNLTYKFRKNEN